MKKLLLSVLALTSVACAGEMNLDEAKAFLTVAKAAVSKKNHKKALEWIDKSKAKFDSAEAEELRAQLLEKQGKGTEAHKALKRAVTLKSLSGDRKVKTGIQTKLEEIKKATAGYEHKRAEYIRYLKAATASSDLYVKSKATEDLKLLGSTKKKVSKPTPTVVFAIADATVRGGKHSHVRHGVLRMLEIKNKEPEFTRRAYLKFNLGGITGDIEKITLRLHAVIVKDTNTHSLALVPNDRWVESKINWTTKPPVSTTVVSWVVKSTGVIDLDITKVALQELRRDRALSLMIEAPARATGSGHVSYASREQKDKGPTLRIEYKVPDEDF